MQTQFYSTLDVARGLSVAEWQVRYLIRTGAIAPPAKSPGGHLLWTRQDVETLARTMDADLPDGFGTDADSSTRQQIVQQPCLN